MSEVGLNSELNHNDLAGREKNDQSYLSILSAAINSKDKETLKETFTKLKDTIESVTDVKCSPISDYEIEELLNKGSTIIHVGTGSSGDRIIISGGKIHMSVDRNNPYGKMRRDMFRAIFGLPHVEIETEDPYVDLQ